jgi:hypothetical protein
MGFTGTFCGSMLVFEAAQMRLSKSLRQTLADGGVNDGTPTR